MFIVKQEDSQQNSDYLWQIIRDLGGELLANYLITPKTENAIECFKVVSRRSQDKLNGESRDKELVLINSNVQNVLIKPI